MAPRSARTGGVGIGPSYARTAAAAIAYAAVVRGNQVYTTKAALRLPFEGRWTVFWGGRTVDANYHSAFQGQRFAYDLIIKKDGLTHAGDGTRNEQYYCFGAPLVAPAAGKVVAAVADLPDNVPGQMDPEHPCGNHVVLDLGQGGFAFLAHFLDYQADGKRVARGEPTRGQVVAPLW